MVRLVGPYRVLVPLGREQAFAADGFEALAYSTNPGKQVDKSEAPLTFHLCREQAFQ